MSTPVKANSTPRFRAAFLDGKQVGEAWADDDVTEKDIFDMADAIVMQQGPCWAQLEVRYLADEAVAQ